MDSLTVREGYLVRLTDAVAETLQRIFGTWGVLVSLFLFGPWRLFATRILPRLLGGGNGVPKIGGDVKGTIATQVRFLVQMVQTKRRIASYMKKKQYTVADFFQWRLDQSPDKEALVFVDFSQSYRDLENASNKMANALSQEGVKQGDVVALLMENRPEFVVLWLAVAKLGGVTALINTSVRGDPLMSVLEVSKATSVIFDAEMVPSLDGIEARLPGMQAYSLGGSPAKGLIHLDALVDASSTDPIDPSVRNLRTVHDEALYIFTSGTTGLPKAARIKHSRMIAAGCAVRCIMGVTGEDRVYSPLPLCHSAATYLVAGVWETGSTLISRKKFSATNFFPDCKKHRVTVMQYIGELCRYLILTPPSHADTDHSVRLAIGNGMRPDVWKELVCRFQIPNVLEGYGSTEGNVSLFNNLNKIGAVGYLPPLVAAIYPMTIVKFDDDSQLPHRSGDGYCVRSGYDEVGEALCQIVETDPFRRFDGYTSKEASDRKVLRNVFKKGDKYFRSGDLLKRDVHGFVYFVDRVGDTFRWKGENVATTEVSQVLDSAGILSSPANVYGVQVEQQDGRAGMAAVCPNSDLDIDSVGNQHARETDREYIEYLLDNSRIII